MKYKTLHSQDFISILENQETGKIELSFDDGVGGCGEGDEEDAKKLYLALSEIFETRFIIRCEGKLKNE